MLTYLGPQEVKMGVDKRCVPPDKRIKCVILLRLKYV